MRADLPAEADRAMEREAIPHEAISLPDILRSVIRAYAYTNRFTMRAAGDRHRLPDV